MPLKGGLDLSQCSVSFSLCNYDSDGEEDEEEQQEASFVRQHNRIVWHLKKVYGGVEQILRVKFNWNSPLSEDRNLLKEIGSME